MNVGDAIFNILDNDAAVSAIVGSRIFPNQIPQGEEFPVITYQYVSNQPTHIKNTVSKLDSIMLDVDLWSGGTGDTYRDLVALAGAVRDALDRFSGTKEGVIIDSIQFLDQIEEPGNNAQEYHITQQYKIRERL